MKKLKRDEIEKANQIYKLFQIKKEIKYEELTN